MESLNDILKKWMTKEFLLPKILYISKYLKTYERKNLLGLVWYFNPRFFHVCHFLPLVREVKRYKSEISNGCYIYCSIVVAYALAAKV